MPVSVVIKLTDVVGDDDVFRELMDILIEDKLSREEWDSMMRKGNRPDFNTAVETLMQRLIKTESGRRWFKGYSHQVVTKRFEKMYGV